MVTITEVREGKTEEEIAAEQEALANAEGETQVGDDTATAGGGDDTVEGGEAGSQAETLVVTIGDQQPEEEDKNLNFKQLRENRRELARENRELKRKLEATQGSQQADTLGPKPKLEDFQYDQAAYDAAHESYVLKKAEAAAKERAEAEAKAKADADWQEKVNKFGAAQEEFKKRAPDYADAQLAIDEALNATQRGLLLKEAVDAPLLVYALYKNPAKLKELQAIADPTTFLAQLIRTEAQLKVSTKQTQQQPEERVGGTVSTSRGVDQQLAKLQAEAFRTGDISKVHAYKRQQREKASKAA